MNNERIKPPDGPITGLQLTCPHCGESEYLRSDATAEWDTEVGEWVLIDCRDKDQWCVAPDCPSEGEPIDIVETKAAPA